MLNTIPEEFRQVLRDVVLKSLKKAQELKNNEDGVFLGQMQKEQFEDLMHLMKTNPMAGLLADMTCTKLVTEDEIYTNHDFAKFSHFPMDGYRLWSSYMANEFKGYKLNDDMTLWPDTAPTQSYAELVKILATKNFEGNEEVKKHDQFIKENKFTYLNEGEAHPQVYLASLMRSGNSLFRRIIEKTTGTIVGANFNTLLTGCFSTLL